MASVVQTPQSAIQPMPPLNDEQIEALRADIAENGVLVPITVDQNGRILDGNNRAAIAAELGIDCPRVAVEVVDDEAAVGLALTLNCARRHLTREQKRELIASELRRRPDDSDRAIGRRLGCSPSTVGAVRKPAEEVSNLDTPLTEKERALLAEGEQMIKTSLKNGRGAIYALVGQALSSGISVTEVIGALTMAKMCWLRRQDRDTETLEFMAKHVFDYVIEVTTWQETLESFPAPTDANPSPELRAILLQGIVDMGAEGGAHPADAEAAE